MTALVISIICLVFCVFGFLFLRRYIERKTSANNLLSDYREEVYRLIAEIDSATDRDSLLVEERIKTLKKVIEDTDRRIAVFMRELQRSEKGQALYTSLGHGIRVALDSGTNTRKNAKSAASSAEKDLPAPEAPAAKKSRVKKRRSREDNGLKPPEKPKIRTKIAEMSANGISPGEIASKLNLSLAEVELALNLLNESFGKKNG